MFFPSTLLVICWKTHPTISLRIWLVRPIPNAKYTIILYPYIPEVLNYSSTFTVYFLTNYCIWSGIILSAYCVKVHTICIWPHVQCHRMTVEWMEKRNNYWWKTTIWVNFHMYILASMIFPIGGLIDDLQINYPNKFNMLRKYDNNIRRIYLVKTLVLLYK